MLWLPCHTTDFRSGRPEEFDLDLDHYLANGLVFAGLGRTVGSTHYTDSSPYGNHGVLTNMEPATDWVFDQTLGRWCTLYDKSNRILTNTAQSVAGMTNFTMAAFIKPSSSLDENAGIIAIGNYVPAFAFAYATNLLYVYFGSSLNSNIVCVRDIWQHVVVTRTSNNLRFYVNAVPDTSTTSVVTTTSAGQISVGCDRVGAGLEFWGSIADPLIYRRALSLSEIQQLADPSNVMLSGLILPPRRRLWAVSGGAPPTTNRRRRVLLAGVPR